MITLIALVFAVSYALWIFYLAVMNLKRVRDAGKLGTVAKVFGYPVLLVGYVLDVLVNVTLMTVLFLEIPRETTVTARLKRHNRTGSGWRQRLAAWFEPLIDPYDPSGNHI
jgi:uncharacterized membrane protein YhaH (DUF805 family)